MPLTALNVEGCDTTGDAKSAVAGSKRNNKQYCKTHTHQLADG